MRKFQVAVFNFDGSGPLKNVLVSTNDINSAFSAYKRLIRRFDRVTVVESKTGKTKDFYKIQ